MAEIRRWFDSHSSPQAVEGFHPLASGYISSAGKVCILPRPSSILKALTHVSLMVRSIAIVVYNVLPDAQLPFTFRRWGVAQKIQQ